MPFIKSPNGAPVCNIMLMMMLLMLMLMIQFDRVDGVIDVAVERPKYEAAKQKWETKRDNRGYINYQEIYCAYETCMIDLNDAERCTTICQNRANSYGEMKVEVDASGTIISVQNFLGMEVDPLVRSYFTTVDNLFFQVKIVLDGADKTTGSLNVEYDPVLGYPTDFYSSQVSPENVYSYRHARKSHSLCFLCDDP